MTVTVAPVALRPLGVRTDLPLTDAQLAALTRLAGFDLEPTRRALRRGFLPDEWVDDAMFEFRRFVGLHVITDSPHPMVCQAVDEVWHTLILSTRAYARFCAETLGYFLHHRSAAAEAEDGRASKGAPATEERSPSGSRPSGAEAEAEDGDGDGDGDGPSGYHEFAAQYQRAYGPMTRMWKFPVLWWDPKRAHCYRPAP